MRVILFAFMIIAAIFIYDHWYALMYLANPYKCTGIFGVPGSGKSTYLNKLVYKAAKKKKWKHIYVNWESKIPGVEYYDDIKFKKGEWLPEANSLLCIDEASLIYNNRDFKNNFTPKTLAWWKFHRHYKVAILWTNQSYDAIDRKIRDECTDGYVLCKRAILQTFISNRTIIKKIGIQNVESGEKVGGTITDSYQYDIIPGFTFIPRWIKLFDSFETKTAEKYK